MAICKECGTKNPDESKFCSECGGVLATIDAVAVQAALDKVEKEFQKDAQASLDRTRLTYICDICGKVNPIDTPDKRCLRCGKKMPRSEYVKALKKIKEAKAVQQNLIQDMPADQNLPAQTVAPQPAPVAQPTPEAAPQPVVYRMNGNSPRVQSSTQQNGQIIQPFVIVPYVSQNQPVLQYSPNSVYRYHEYTDSEKRRNQETLARIQKEREEAERQRIREEERLARIEKEERERYNADSARERRYRADYGFKKPNGRLTALLSFACAAVAIVIAVLFKLSSSVALIDSIKDFIAAPEAYFGALELPTILCLAGLLVFVVAMAFVAIIAFIRLFKKSFKRKQLLFPVLASFGVCSAIVGCVLNGTIFATEYLVLQIVMIATSVVAFIIEAATRTNKQLY